MGIFLFSCQEEELTIGELQPETSSTPQLPSLCVTSGTPIIQVESEDAYEVCQNEVFEAYVAAGWRQVEWLYNSSYIVPAAGYTKNDNPVKFKVVGSPYTGSTLSVKAAYCNGTVVNSGNSWTFGIQNCGGPHI